MQPHPQRKVHLPKYMRVASVVLVDLVNIPLIRSVPSIKTSHVEKVVTQEVLVKAAVSLLN
jgi:hypothetical protein